MLRACTRTPSTCPSSAASSRWRSRSSAPKRRRETGPDSRCRKIMRLSFVAVATLGSLAHAEPAHIGFGAASMRVSIARAAVVVDRGTATVTLKFTADSRDRREGEAAIDIPHGARVVGLTLRAGGATHVGRTLAVDEAHTQYTATKEQTRDPALLEWVGSSADRERLRLRVFPVAKYRSAFVEIRIEMPRLAELAIDSQGVDTTLIVDTRTWEDVRRPRTFAITGAERDPQDAIDAGQAWLADETPAPRGATRTEVAACATLFCGSAGHR